MLCARIHGSALVEVTATTSRNETPKLTPQPRLNFGFQQHFLQPGVGQKSHPGKSLGPFVASLGRLCLGPQYTGRESWEAP
jgi:hypothetical protein